MPDLLSMITILTVCQVYTSTMAIVKNRRSGKENFPIAVTFLQERMVASKLPQQYSKFQLCVCARAIDLQSRMHGR